MAEGDVTNNDAADANAGEGATEEGGAEQEPTSEPSGVGDPTTESPRPGDWNPSEQSGGGGELY